MRITIVLIFVLLPIFVSIIFRSLPQELRAILLLPALILLCYDAMAYLSRSKQERDRDMASPSRAFIFSWHHFQSSIKPMLCSSAAVIATSVLFASMPMIFGWRISHDMVGGFASAIAGGILFNACLVEKNWEVNYSIFFRNLICIPEPCQGHR